MVRAAFELAAERNVPLAGFLGDECVTLRMTPELEVRQYPGFAAGEQTVSEHLTYWSSIVTYWLLHRQEVYLLANPHPRCPLVLNAHMLVNYLLVAS